MLRRPSVRLYAIVARAADVAVVFRRGPSKQVQLLKWNLRTDEIEPGQWFKGRIEERWSDLSPDGKQLVYFANKYKGDPAAWTAVSHPPYFTALALWPESQLSYGGGEFLTNRDLLLHEHPCEVHPDFVAMMKHPKAVRIVGDKGAAALGHKAGNYGGWQTVQLEHNPSEEIKGWWRLLRWILKSSKISHPKAWRKPQPGGDHVLITPDWMSWAHPGRILTADGTILHHFDHADWFDWDHRGQLLYAAKGCLWRVADVADSKSEPKLVADLNANKFTEVVAPDWAKQW